MKIRTKIGTGKAVHAADYNPHTGAIALFCGRQTYPTYFAAISDDTEPTAENVTCKKCIKILNLKRGRHMKFYVAYVKNQDPTYEAAVFEDKKMDFAQHERLILNGWELVLDNRFESEAAVYKKLAEGVILESGEEVQAFKTSCEFCGWHLPTIKVKGKYMNHRTDRLKTFSGELCEQCAESLELIEFEGRMMPPGEMDSILKHRGIARLKGEK